MNNVTVNRVSYNGGHGGINARPNAAQEAALRERHIAPTSVQTQHEQMARTDRSQWASVNHGRPEVAATPKPTAFHGAGVVTAKNAPVTNNPAVQGSAIEQRRTARTIRGPTTVTCLGRQSVRMPTILARQAQRSTHSRTMFRTPTIPFLIRQRGRMNLGRTTAAAPHTNNPTVAHNSSHASPAEPARQAPHPPAHVNQGEPAPHGKNAANVPRPPARETAPRPNNATAPRPENPTVAHNMGHPSPPRNEPCRRLTRQSARTNRLRM